MKHLPNPPVISVIIPCRGHAPELKNCLEGLTQQNLTCPYEIIVVDSAADKAVADVVATFSTVDLVRSQDELLPGGARNFGVLHAHGRYLTFIDADCIPEPGWLAAAVAALQDGNAKMVGGPILDARPLHPIAVADNWLQFADFPCHRPDGAASYFPGCNLALSQATFTELGGFPTNLPAGEDVLFSRTAAKRWPDEVRFVSAMQIRHNGRTRLGAFWQHQETFGYYRGWQGLQLKPLYQRLGSRAILAVFVVCKRLSYITFRTAQWNPTGLLRLIVLLPLILLGLAAWAKGFRRGCLVAAKETLQ